MDYRKDTFYKTGESSNKGQGHVSGAYNNGNINAGSHTDTNALANKPAYDFSIFLNKKTEKLTTALYMVTSFLSDSEPIKWKLRECGVVLLSDIATVKTDSVSEVENIFADYACSVDEILSLLEVASASRLISDMNFSILKKEYISLKDLIISNEYAENKTGRFVFPDNFFQEEKTLPSPADNLALSKALTDNSASQPDTPKGHIENNTHTQPSSLSLKISQRHRGSSQGKYSSGSRLPAKTNKDIKATKTDRRSAVLKLFKKNKELTIKDISSEISDCSEKTIQRELLALVSDGVLNKKGERRWSRYSLK